MSASLLVVAGETSGDMHAAGLLRALRLRRPDLPAWGIGGPALRAAGLETVRDTRDMAVMGLWDVLLRLSFFRRVFRETCAEAARRRPTAALLVDYPGFNLRLAAALKRMGIPVVYYICPQVWAWHRSRIHRIARIVDRLLVIFPFEVELFRQTGLDVEFVGHPLAEETADHAGDRRDVADWPGRPRIALLPGSRRQEIERILPVLIEAAFGVEQKRPDAGFLVAASSDEAGDQAAQILARARRRPRRLRIVTGRTRDILRTADAAWVTSGTATLEAALQNCPMVVVYRTAALTYHAARAVVRIPHIGLVNIVAERQVCPELVQGAARPAALSEALLPLLDETPERQRMKDDLADVARRLGGGNASDRAADAVDRFLQQQTDRETRRGHARRA